MIDIQKHSIFTEYVYSFDMPNFDFWKKQINEIVKVEDNQDHNLSTDLKFSSNVKAKRTAWDTHHRYQSMFNIACEFVKILQSFVESEGFDAPKIDISQLWINWYAKNQLAVPHRHNNHLSLVFFVDVEKTDTFFLIHKEYKNCFLMKKEDKTTYNNKVVEMKVKDGTCIMFDGGLYHSTTPNLTNNLRTTLAANFEVHYPTRKKL